MEQARKMPATPACDKSAVCEAARVVTNEEKVNMEPARDCLAVILRAGANDALLIPTGHAARPRHNLEAGKNLHFGGRGIPWVAARRR